MKLQESILKAKGYQECPRCRGWSVGECPFCPPPASANGVGASNPMPEPGQGPKTPGTRLSGQKKGMSKTEARFQTEVLRGAGKFEAVTLVMDNGHRYTPDFLLVDKDGGATVYEVKGSYRLGSYQRARLAYDQARVEFPWIKFRWFERTKEGWAEK